MLIETRNESQFLAARVAETLPATDANLLQRFKAVRDKSGTYYQQLLCSGSGQIFEDVIGVRLKPRVSPKSRLKSDGKPILRQIG